MALSWRANALRAKGGSNCPYAVKVEINQACFDYFRLLHLQSFLVADCNHRLTLVNRRRRELPTIHSQYDTIDARFSRRVEALELDKAAPIDLATRLADETRKRNLALS